MEGPFEFYLNLQAVVPSKLMRGWVGFSFLGLAIFYACVHTFTIPILDLCFILEFPTAFTILIQSAYDAY